jgi:hypothetical protein
MSPIVASDSHIPNPSFGTGKIIEPGRYGHVEVEATPANEPGKPHVVWAVRGGTIPDMHRHAVLAAAEEALVNAATGGHLRCAVRLTIDGGSFHESMESAHAEAAVLAVVDALQRGNYLRKDRE